MSRHRSPEPPRRWLEGWQPSIGAAAGAIATFATVFGLGQAIAPDATAATAATEPTTSTITEGNNSSWHRTPAGGSGLGPLRLTAPSVTPTSAPSPDSTATEPPVDAWTPQGSPREQVGAFSGATPVPSGTPGSSTPIVSTPSTPPASPPSSPPPTTTQPPSPTTSQPAATTTPTTAPTTSPPIDTTTAPEETVPTDATEPPDTQQ